MKTIYKISLTAIFVFSMFSLSAQSYENAVGLRGGWYDGITFRHMLSETKAVEGLFTSRWRGFNITGLYEIQAPLKQEGFDWYYGAGAHIGSFNRYYYYRHDLNNPNYYTSGPILAVGIDAIAGVEYTLKDIPLNIGLDIHPLVELADGGFWPWYDAAFSVRYKIN